MFLHIKVKPRSRQNRIERDAEGNWIVRVTAPAEDGKANAALIKFLSEKLHVSKTCVQITSGHTSHFKKISIEELSDADVYRRLSEAV